MQRYINASLRVIPIVYLNPPIRICRAARAASMDQISKLQISYRVRIVDKAALEAVQVFIPVINKFAATWAFREYQIVAVFVYIANQRFIVCQ